MTQKSNIHLVMGVSNVGKSTYISSILNRGVNNTLPVLMAYELGNSEKEERLNHECIVHYNLLRVYENDAANIGRDIQDDPVFKNLLKHGERIRVYMLVAHRSEILKRCLLRSDTEPLLRGKKTPYPHQKVIELLCRLNLSEFYKKWFVILQQHKISFEIIDSSNESCLSMDSEFDAISLLDDQYRVQYSQKEISHIVDNNYFEYQKFEICSNQYTYGQDRSVSLKFLDDNLEGKSLLDIGCAYGYFCFEAEKRNAKRVIGTELKAHRYIGFNILKEIYGHKSSVLYQDIFSEQLEEKFDIVLLLNVIHHLIEPVRALRIAANHCTEKLIIEFPTLSNKKFRATLPWWARLQSTQSSDSARALIGVSLIKEKDQTFLFSEEAIRRILMEHARLFTSIKFYQSPMSKDRKLAICYK